MKITEKHAISNKIKEKTDTSRVDKAFKTLKEEMDKYKERNPWITLPSVVSPSVLPEKSEHCLHKNCPECKAGRCSGIHMISCPCRSCSPMLTTERIGYNTVSDTGNRQVFYGKTF